MSPAIFPFWIPCQWLIVIAGCYKNLRTNVTLSSAGLSENQEYCVSLNGVLLLLCVLCEGPSYNTQSYIIVEASVHSRLCVQTLGFQRRQIRRPAVILSEIAKMNFIWTLNVSRTPHLIGLKREYFPNCKLIGVACFSPHWCMICCATVPQSGKFWEQFSEVTIL